MQAVQNGDVGKLEMLFDRHHRGLYPLFSSLTSNVAVSEDLVQEVFFRILKYRHTYQPGTAVRPWMYQIGRNALADQVGRNKGQVALAERAAEIRSPEAPPDRQAQNKEETALLKRALSAMPQEKREVIVMSRFLELKYEEIAHVLNVRSGHGQGAGSPRAAGIGRPVLRAAGRAGVVMICERVREQIPECLAGRLEKAGAGEPHGPPGDLLRRAATNWRNWESSGEVWKVCPHRNRTAPCGRGSWKC